MENFLRNLKKTVILGAGLAMATPSFSEGLKQSDSTNENVTFVHDKKDKKLLMYQDSLKHYQEGMADLKKLKSVAQKHGLTVYSYPNQIRQTGTVKPSDFKGVELIGAEPNAQGVYEKVYARTKGNHDDVVRINQDDRDNQVLMNGVMLYPKPHKVEYQEVSNEEVKEAPSQEDVHVSPETKQDEHVSENETVKIFPIYQDPSDTTHHMGGHVVGYEKITYDKKTGKIVKKEKLN
jgi:hypothetical protein